MIRETNKPEKGGPAHSVV